MLNVLVTGGAGYIGSHTCKLLAQNNLNPISFDNLENGNEWAVKWGPLIKGDLRKIEDIRSALADFKIDAVIHFAGYAYVGESVHNPEKYFQNNLGGTLNLITAMCEANIRKIVFSSSCAVYGKATQEFISEGHLKEPINPYGKSKLLCEQLLNEFSDLGKIDCVSLRYFNAAGADPGLEIGESHNPETHLIPLAINAAIPEGDELLVFGKDHPTADGTCVRDYIHVCDLAKAHQQALNFIQHSTGSHFLNLGSGKGYSVKEIIDMVSEISKAKVRFNFVSRREGDPPRLVADPSAAKSILKWNPEFSDLKNIISTAIGWRQKNHGGPT